MMTLYASASKDASEAQIRIWEWEDNTGCLLEFKGPRIPQIMRHT